MVSNLELINKLDRLENKIDILKSELSIRNWTRETLVNFIQFKTLLRQATLFLQEDIKLSLQSTYCAKKIQEEIDVTFRDYIESVLYYFDTTFNPITCEQDNKMNVVISEKLDTVLAKLDRSY
ncbi:hypothetical protein EB118_07015 [bacterium]|nr:hypothetical protein [bacterium]NDC94395.1 hypothetical protein [bacterium]NDD83936.1 hypothetical protein [bacterium]NDG29831.1 hypothetical protein [bacterium]